MPIKSSPRQTTPALLAEYARQQKLLEAMPDRRLVREAVNGFDRLCWVWEEDGVIRSEAVKEGGQESALREASARTSTASIVHGIELEYGLPAAKPAVAAHVLIGPALEAKARAKGRWASRTSLDELRSFIGERSASRVAAFYGLRRTGKTTIMLQAISGLPIDECAYIRASGADTIHSLAIDLLLLSSMGKRFFFIDDATAIDGFACESSYFADFLSTEDNIVVLSGPESLSIKLSLREGLLGRARLIRTTRMLFSEWLRLTGIPVPGYIRRGGVLHAPGEPHAALPFRSLAGTKAYVLSAIGGNVQHSLDDWRGDEGYGALKALRTAGELANAFQRILASDSHQFLLEAIQKRLRRCEPGTAPRDQQKKRPPASQWRFAAGLLDAARQKPLLARYMSALGVTQQAEAQSLDDGVLRELRSYLADLEFVMPSGVFDPDRAVYAERSLFVQPGLRWSHAELLLDLMRTDPAFLLLPPEDGEELARALREAVEGSILEEIVLRNLALDLQPAGGRGDKPLVLAVREKRTGMAYDAAVRDISTAKSLLLAVAGTSERHAHQARWLQDEASLARTVRWLGQPLARCVVYNGPDAEGSRGVLWRNATRFLSALEHGMRLADLADVLLHPAPAPSAA